MYSTLSDIQKELFLKTSGYEYDGKDLQGFFQTDRPYNNSDYKYSPWTFSYVYVTETGYLICELSHRMTNNRIYGWDAMGNELPYEISKKYFRDDLESLSIVEHTAEQAKIIRFSKEGGINAQNVKESVYSRIDFELPEHIWNEIDAAFADCWNNIIGVTGWVHEGEIEKHIYNHLKSKKILFEYNKIERIVKIIYDYISMTGGWMEE